jgi:hypothetical protein
MSQLNLNEIVRRTIGVARLNVATFEEVEHNPALTREAGIVVVVASLIGSIGGPPRGLNAFISTAFLNVIGWGLWAVITSFVAQRIFHATTNHGEMLRTTGYAYGPRLLGIIPFLSAVGFLWSLVTVVVAIRQAGDVSTRKALVIAAVGLIPYLTGMTIIVAMVR